MSETVRIGTDGGGANVGGEPRSARFGGVQARVNADGTLFLYQPDANRLMSPELADQLAQYLMLHCLRVDAPDPIGPEEGQVVETQSAPAPRRRGRPPKART